MCRGSSTSEEFTDLVDQEIGDAHMPRRVGDHQRNAALLHRGLGGHPAGPEGGGFVVANEDSVTIARSDPYTPRLCIAGSMLKVTETGD